MHCPRAARGQGKKKTQKRMASAAIFRGKHEGPHKKARRKKKWKGCQDLLQRKARRKG